MVRVFLFSVALLAIVLITLSISLLSIPPKPAPLYLSSVQLQTLTAQPQNFSLEEYNKHLNSLLFLYNVQPTHKDILINLALLYQSQDNEDKALNYWNSAKELDPNNPIFRETN